MSFKFPAGVHKLTRVPKGNNIKGKVWREVDVILPDERTVRGRVEENRGAFVYFVDGDNHYRAFVDRFQTVRRPWNEIDIAFDLREK